MKDLIERWKPVITKCPRILKSNWFKFAEALENELPNDEWIEYGYLVNFATKVVPKIAKQFEGA